MVNTPGQSGKPASPHYRDRAATWIDSKQLPLAYWREAAQDAVRERVALTAR